MSILIEGMEMPDSCNHCFVTPGCCPAVRKRIKSDKPGYKWIPANYRHEDCPLIEVPAQHGRLIDADAVERNLLKMQQAQTGPCSHGVRKSRAVLRDAPTIIPASESKERPAFLPQYELTLRSEEG